MSGSLTIAATFPRHETRFVVDGTRIPTTTDESTEIRLVGVSTELSTGQQRSVTLVLPPTDVAQLRLEMQQADPYSTGPDEVAVLDAEGETTAYRIATYRNEWVDGPRDKYEVHAGIWVEDGEETGEFVAFSDPVPVIIVAAAVGALACLARSVIRDVYARCDEQLASSIQACRDAGGLPSVNVDTVFGLKLRPFQIGCTTNCRLDCRMPTAAADRPPQAGAGSAEP